MEVNQGGSKAGRLPVSDIVLVIIAIIQVGFGIHRHWSSYGWFDKGFAIFAVVMLALTPWPFQRPKDLDNKLTVGTAYALILLVALLYAQAKS